MAANATMDAPRLGEAGFYCIELCCGSGNLTFAMKHFFPDSFGIDHKVGKQKVRVICLDLTDEDNQALVEQWAMDENACGFILECRVVRHLLQDSGALARISTVHQFCVHIVGLMVSHP